MKLLFLLILVFKVFLIAGNPVGEDSQEVQVVTDEVETSFENEEQERDEGGNLIVNYLNELQKDDPNLATTEKEVTELSDLISSTEPSSTVVSDNELQSTTYAVNIIETTTEVLSPDVSDVNNNNLEEENKRTTTEETSSVDSNVALTTLEENETTPSSVDKKDAMDKVNKLSEQIRLVLSQYRESGDVKIPNVQIPDPMPIPDMDQKTSAGTFNFMNMNVHGLSNFTVEHVNTDLDKKQVYIMLKMKRLVVLGNYTMRTWLKRASGPFNVTLIDVIAEGAAELTPTEEGYLEASETDMDMTFRDIRLDFKNLGFLGTIFQSVIGAVGTMLFDGIKPSILNEVNTNTRADINDKIRLVTSGLKGANLKMSPVDQALVEGRRYIRQQGYDPYKLNNFTRGIGLFSLNVTEFTLAGLSRLYRVGEVTLAMDNGTVEAGIRLATDKLRGKCDWAIGFQSTILRNGSTKFDIDHLQIRGIVQQNLDLRKRPELYDLDILLGKITLTTDRVDTLDYFIELMVNNLPSLIRHIIVDGLEDPIKDRAQEILNEVDVEAMLDEQLPVLDNLGA